MIFLYISEIGPIPSVVVSSLFCLCTPNCTCVFDGGFVSGTFAGTPPAVGQHPGPLVLGRRPLGSGGGERQEAEAAGAQADEALLTRASLPPEHTEQYLAVFIYIYAESNVQIARSP